MCHCPAMEVNLDLVPLHYLFKECCERIILWMESTRVGTKKTSIKQDLQDCTHLLDLPNDYLRRSYIYENNVDIELSSSYTQYLHVVQVVPCGCRYESQHCGHVVLLVWQQKSVGTQQICIVYGPGLGKSEEPCEPSIRQYIHVLGWWHVL